MIMTARERNRLIQELIHNKIKDLRHHVFVLLKEIEVLSDSLFDAMRNDQSEEGSDSHHTNSCDDE